MSQPKLLVICSTTPRMDAALAPHFEMLRLSEMSDQTDMLASVGPDIPYVLTDGHLGVPPEVLAQLTQLKAVSSYGVGYDGIDTDATCGRGIQVSHTPDVLNDEVATTAVMLYLACYRNFRAEMDQAHSGAWEGVGASDWGASGTLPLSRTADGRKVGILGLGRIGAALALKLQAFGCEVHYHNRTRKDVAYTYHADLTEMATAVEALICVAPGGAATRHLINARVIEALGPKGVLVNIGRGSTVDQDALIAALKAGKLGWAGLDVFEAEPHIPEALRALPNAILTPHIGSATVETRAAMGDLAVANLVSHLETGKMITPVPESAEL